MAAFLLQMENGNGKLPLVFRKWKMDIYFSWSANDKR
jgi:hypothetical protein